MHTEHPRGIAPAWGSALARAGLGLGLVLALSTPSTAQDAPPADAQVVIIDPGTLRPGTTGAVRVEVRLSDRSPRPLLLTPTVEGAALEVVRGRLLRADATPAPDGTLRFALPVRVAAAGTSVLHVVLSTYNCEARCRPVRASATRVIRSGD